MLLSAFIAELGVGLHFVFKVLPHYAAFVYLRAVIGCMGGIALAFFGPFWEVDNKVNMGFGYGFVVAKFALY